MVRCAWHGSAATVAAVGLARDLTTELQLLTQGVVLGANERNPVARAAYLRAGFVEHGRYLGGRSVPQHIMYSPF